MPRFPWTDDPEASRLVIEADGAVAGMIQFTEQPGPRYRHASIDPFLDPSLHSRSIGPTVVRRIAEHLFVDRGHHRITIDPAAINTAAIRSYTKARFCPVGVMRQYERAVEDDSWHDGLLMELLADDASSSGSHPATRVIATNAIELEIAGADDGAGLLRRPAARPARTQRAGARRPGSPARPRRDLPARPRAVRINSHQHRLVTC